MKSSENNIVCVLSRLFLLVCLLVGWFGDAKACKLEDTYRYTVVLEGSDKVRIKMPLYDKEDNDCWVQYGYLTIQIEGEATKETVVTYWSEEDISRSDYFPKCTIKKSVDGEMTMYRDRGYSTARVTNTSTGIICPCVSGGDYAIVNLLWTVPDKYRGKKVTFHWYIHHNGNNTEYDKEITGIADVTFPIPSAPAEVKPILMDPIISYDASHANQIMVPYMMAASNVEKIRAIYVDGQGIAFPIELDKNKTSGFVYLPAEAYIDQFFIQATYKDSEGNNKTVRSETISLPVLHNPKRLATTLQNDGKVTLTWSVDRTNWNDVQPTDNWEIQRNVSGDPSNNQWVTIGQEAFNEKFADYTFTDEALLSQYAEQVVYYRVRRTITALWNWADNSGYAQTVLATKLMLPAVTSGTVQRTGEWNDDNHEVALNFQIGPRELRTAQDWVDLANLVNESVEGTSFNVVMMNDIELSENQSVMIGKSNAFHGVFDGNGHTLTFNLSSTDVPYAAPFRYVGNANIRNLHVKGSITTSVRYASGLVGYMVYNTSPVIENCISSINLKSTVNGRATMGGLLGVDETKMSVILRNCLFDGSFEGENCYGNAGLVAYTPGTVSQRLSIQNCLFAPSRLNTKTDDCSTLADGVCNISNSAYTVAYGSVPYASLAIDAKGMSAADLQTYLGDGWTVSDDKVIPVQSSYATIWDKSAKAVLTIEKLVRNELRYTERRELTEEERIKGNMTVKLATPCVDYRFYMVVEKGNSKLPLTTTERIQLEPTDAGEYSFDNNVKLTNAKAETEQNYVSLSWETERGQADYYRILRSDQMTPDIVDTLKNNLLEPLYIDRTVRPQHTYIYTIEGVTQCEGENVSRVTVKGNCKPTGMVRGYVRLPNGTGLPGCTVTATPDNIPGAEAKSTVTDETGFFEIGDLVYTKYGIYILDVSTPNNDGSFTSQRIVFDDEVNLQTNINFTQDSYYLFSGFVLYEGTSIPVTGVEFLRDGRVMKNALGKTITTDSQGAFTLSIPQGSHQIQVVKKGHTFKNDGYFTTPDGQPDSTWHNWTKNVSDIYLWDQTKVNLMGRVAGGKDQGSLKLGESLSKNNLGDDLTIVLQLEGDNTSWLVRDQKDPTVTERHEVFTHGKTDTTRVDAYRHRIVIHPDKMTGEYLMPVCPAKYKVTEIYAKGYSTLFQNGMVSEVIDLNSCNDGDSVTYSRIYHSMPTLDVWQFNGSDERYYGIKKYTSRDNAGNSEIVKLWNNNSYTLGHPVFMAGSTVPMMLSAREEYYYNNDKNGNLDIVQLDGGKVIINNGLIANNHSDSVALDKDGQGSYVFTPQNTTFTQVDDVALRTMNITLLYDGVYYDIQPIRGYVMASMPKSQGRRVVAGRNTHLVDVLRDPPGSGSSAYIEKGTKFNYSYTADYKVEAGIGFEIGVGAGNNYYTGVVGGTTEAGDIGSVKNYAALGYDLKTGYYQDWSYNYTIETNEKITTSSSSKEIGANADVYIGITDNVILEDGIAVRVVNSKGMERLKPGMGGTVTVDGHDYRVTGTAKILARGYDAEQEDSVYLVRDEVLQLKNKVTSTFAHSQHYLTDELIPSLVRVRNSLLLDYTTSASEAQAMADNLQTPVYVSKVATTDTRFGGEYTQYLPQNTTIQWSDSIKALNNEIRVWVGMIGANEKAKLEAAEKVNVYDFDGSTSVSYSESFNTSSGLHRYIILPASAGISGGGISGGTNNGGTTSAMDLGDGDPEFDYTIGGIALKYKIKPIANFNFNYKNGVDSTFTKKIGFTLACSRNSNLTVGVYRDNGISGDSLKALIELGQAGLYYQHVEENLKLIYNGRPGSSNTTSYLGNLSSTPRARNFVYRTLAGATASPWEDERRTIYYTPGTILDQKTQEIDQLRIWAKEASVANVPYGDPARFTIYMANESEMPARATKSLKYFLQDSMNPDGAKVLIDGAPLTGSGTNLYLEPGTIVEKQVEVFAGAGYDYENLGISIYDENDPKRLKTVTLSAHFVPSAGPVNISKPGDKWIVNTESAYDEERQAYYLPVHIDGFDVNFRNFDHIELQYKLSTQSDKDWVNVCSYYRNDAEGEALMAQASGARELMKNEGFIDAAFYGEKDPVEQYYDLRAVTYCRNGSGYLTRSSNVLSGIKDTRLPEVFGTPEPTNGILGIGDDILIKFSEPIASNYLSKVNNFEVLGTLLSNDISTATSLSFDGNSTASTQGERNLKGKSFTVDIMLNPASDDQREMTVFSHGGDEKGVRFGVTADRKLSATINGETLESDTIVPFNNSLHQVAYVLDQSGETTTVKFYDGNRAIGVKQLEERYEGASSEILLGADFDLTRELSYKGEMLEFRLWNRAMSGGDLADYAKKKLTGYETGLLDYYPLNEGDGDWAYDKAAGSMDLMLIGTSWKRPAGISIAFKGDKGLRLKSDKFMRTKNHDYTLTFWFRTNDENATLFSNGEAKRDQENQINIGVKNRKLYVRSQGFEVQTSAYVSEGTWHHFAMTVSRSQNISNVYVDKKLVESFPADSLAGIMGNHIALGATYIDKNTPTNVMNGHIDEVGMFESVLPLNLIKEYSNHTPLGTMSAMMAYLDFGRSVKLDNNMQYLEPTGISLKRYSTNQGELTERRDTLVADADVQAMAARDFYAPMTSNAQLDNLRYSYVAKDNELYMNIKEPDYMVEKTNIYVTVKEVADLQGNPMASPVTMNLYVSRNPLRWNVKRIDEDVNYGEGVSFEATVKNLSGVKQNFKVEDLPLWINASQTEGVLDALDEQKITFTVSDFINIGTYNEQVALVGDNKMSEPLPITLRVRGDKPDWAVGDSLIQMNETMMMVARVKIDGMVASSKEDILAAFDENHRVLGVAHIEINDNANANEALAYLTIYGYLNNDASRPKLSFRFFDASSGNVYSVKPADGQVYTFKQDALIGTDVNPVILQNSYDFVQTIKLKEGWNWVSFNLVPKEGTTLGQFMNSMSKWEIDDKIVLIDGKRTQTFTCRSDSLADSRQRWEKENKLITIDPSKMYSIFSKSDKTIYLEGEFARRYITVHKNWNRLGYNSTINLPIAQALADYLGHAQVGDVVKSQDGFAIVSQSATGLVWKGSLQYMEAGKGYMLKRQADDEVKFLYPIYLNDSRYSSTSESRAPKRSAVNTATTMNIVAAVEGVVTETGDKLVVYRGAERMAEAVADNEQHYYLNIGSDDNTDQTLTFVLERNGETMAITGSRISYAANKVLGTPEEPTAINFMSLAEIPHDGKWYTLGGVLIGKKPTRSGLYIYNGKVMTIK